MTLPPGPFNPGTHRGRAAVQRVMEDYLTAFELWVVTPEELFDVGDQVVAFVKNRIRPRESSAELEIRVGALWTIGDGTVLSLRVFPEPETALEAAGPCTS
jgi:ketosteroid isomerase-like protein